MLSYYLCDRIHPLRAPGEFRYNATFTELLRSAITQFKMSSRIAMACLVCSTAVAQMPNLRLNSDAAGQAMITLKNNARKDLAAIVYTVVLEDSATGNANPASLRFYDAFSDRYQEPIPPNRALTIRSGMSARNTRVELVAGAFVDGSSFGDPEMIQHLAERRRYTLAVLDQALQILNAPHATRLSRNDLRDRFEAAKASQLAAARDSDEKLIVTSLYGLAIHNLANPTDEILEFLKTNFEERRARLLAAPGLH